MNMNRKYHRGFTVLELLTTVVVVGVIAALAGPPLQSMMANQRVRNASYDLSSSLVFARDQATKRTLTPNATIKVIANSANWSGGWQVLDASNNVLLNRPAYVGINVVTNTTTSGSCSTPCVIFNRLGRIDSASVTDDGRSPAFRLVNSSGSGTTTRCLGIDSSGRVNTAITSC